MLLMLGRVAVIGFQWLLVRSMLFSDPFCNEWCSSTHRRGNVIVSLSLWERAGVRGKILEWYCGIDCSQTPVRSTPVTE